MIALRQKSCHIHTHCRPVFLHDRFVQPLILVVGYLNTSLNFTLIKNKKIEQHIKKIYKFIILKF